MTIWNLFCAFLHLTLNHFRTWQTSDHFYYVLIHKTLELKEGIRSTNHECKSIWPTGQCSAHMVRCFLQPLQTVHFPLGQWAHSSHAQSERENDSALFPLVILAPLSALSVLILWLALCRAAPFI